MAAMAPCHHLAVPGAGLPPPTPPCPAVQMNVEVNARLRELHTTLETGERLRDGVLQTMAANLATWVAQVGGVAEPAACRWWPISGAHCCGRAQGARA
jgi:hypothetical protein